MTLPSWSDLMAQQFITTATMKAASQREEITHLSAAEIVVRVIRQRNVTAGAKTNTPFHAE